MQFLRSVQIIDEKVSGNTKDSYRFMVVGHPYTHPTENKEQGGYDYANGLNRSFLKFLRTFPLIGFRHVVFTGDFTHDGRPDQWDKVEEQIKDFPVEFKFVAGNHDIGNNDDSQRDTFLKRAGRDQMFDSFFIEKDLFIILDGAAKNVEGQISLLENEIKKEHRNLFVFMHYVWWAREFGFKGNSDLVPQEEGVWKKVMALLTARKEKVVVFAGDASKKFDVAKVENVTLISNGLEPGYWDENEVAVVKVGDKGVDIIPTPIS